MEGFEASTVAHSHALGGDNKEEVMKRLLLAAILGAVLSSCTKSPTNPKTPDLGGGFSITQAGLCACPAPGKSLGGIIHVQLAWTNALVDSSANISLYDAAGGSRVGEVSLAVAAGDGSFTGEISVSKTGDTFKVELVTQNLSLSTNWLPAPACQSCSP